MPRNMLNTKYEEKYLENREKNPLPIGEQRYKSLIVLIRNIVARRQWNSIFKELKVTECQLKIPSSDNHSEIKAK